MLNEINSFIFDLDDTLVESERLNVFLISDYFKGEWELDLDEEDRNIVFGYSWQHIYDFITKKYALPVSIAEVQDDVIARKRNYLSNNKLKVATGLEKVLALPMRKVIVSGSGKDEINIMLENVGLCGSFEALFSVDDYINGKPAPDGFLMALNYLRVARQNVVVFEDSKGGIVSAREAGLTSVFMKEFAVADHSHMADHSFSDFNEFYAYYLQLA
ncbi:MAG: hypothetical protein A2X42_04950 [Candidatus Margulisbacteria bacterium GWF2_38_17]|nr:MAG: hypothetical protein A2X43_08725 [Candidatus Margulisbacteria bacterium GWD2_39_127]OGI01673.1 MAG: hypothetical protein A2X42_04950 [Candidatus Margulisbacteria bacterium GWF2_38_17]OGI05852.1 MAG: hypothetical protein A2X41_04425 [Candidatus Margulisbacteria bacterium GWE2_39_32]